MRILLINVPHPSIGSRIPDDHLPPLGLLAVGEPLIDDGHDVRLIDGEFGPMSPRSLIAEAVRLIPDAVLFGHSGSTSGHPIIAEVASGVALSVTKLRPDNYDPRKNFRRLKRWRSRIEKGGGKWQVINNLETLDEPMPD